MGDGEGNDQQIDIRFGAFGISTSGRFDGFAPISGYTFNPGNTTGGTLRCSNTYCHGNFTGGINTNKPKWDDPASGDCGTCHGTTAATLANHSIHLNGSWGPFSSCDDCHPANSSTGRHPTHVDGKVEFKDGLGFAATTACAGCHGNGTATAKADWGLTVDRGQTQWCEKCHDGSSVIKGVTAGNVVGNVAYGFDVSGHGKPSIGLGCVDCHDYRTVHVDGNSQTYSAALNNFKAAYRLSVSNTVPLLGVYTTTKIALCYSCHIENKLVGMPAGGKPSDLHMHSVKVSTQWYTNFRNMSTVAGKLAGNYNDNGDVPTNIHWNHLDDYGSVGRSSYFSQKLYDSDGDGSGDSYITCETCHNPHGTRQRAMVIDQFSIKSFDGLANESVTPSYRWLGSSAYVTTRCTDSCHLSGNAMGTAGTRWYGAPLSGGTTGIPVGLKAEPLP
jgi:predicted CxxxxCH...CXXCH cytochrome family protein